MLLLCSNIYGQSFHLFSTSGGTGSSHVNFLLHTSLKMIFPVIVKNATQPSTSYSELMVDVIFLLVRISCSLMQGVKSNSRVSVDFFHDIPSILVLSSALTGISFNSSRMSSNSNALTLECHLYSVNPVSAKICIASTLNLRKLSMLSPPPHFECHLRRYPF